MTDMLPRASLPTRCAHEPSQAQKDGDECMSCDVPFTTLSDRVPLDRRVGYRCADTAACAQRRAWKYGKQQASGREYQSRPEDGHDVDPRPTTPTSLAARCGPTTDVVTSQPDGA